MSIDRARIKHAFGRAALQAARLAAESSFREYGHAITTQLAWNAITVELELSDPELFDALPREMPPAFRTEYRRVAAELTQTGVS